MRIFLYPIEEARRMTDPSVAGGTIHRKPFTGKEPTQNQTFRTPPIPDMENVETRY